MHYLIIAVLAFGLSLMGCEGKTGPAGPTGPAGSAGPAGPAGPQGSTGPAGPAGADGADGAQGPAGPAGPMGPAGADGADGADGAQGPAGPAGADGAQGPAGPAGPQGPAGIPDTGGIDPIQLAQAHHIAIKVGDGDKENATDGVSTTMRVGEDVMIVAAARAQSEKVLEGIPVAIAITKNDDEAITLEDGMITAVGAGSAEITAMSDLAGIAGKLTVMVTKPIDEIVFMVGTGDDAADGPSSIVLAAGQVYKDEITAVAHDEDGKEIMPRSNWSWTSTDKAVATVAARKDDDDALVDKGAHGTITGKGPGDAEIMATAEGVSGSISVSVSGQVQTRILRASTSDTPNNTFVYDRDSDTPAWDPATIAFQVNLYDIFSGDRIAGTVTAVSADTDLATVAVTTQPAAATPGLITVTPVLNPGDGTNDTDTDAGSQSVVITVSTVAADPVRVNFTLTVKDAPE
ncbi:MAG: collagen-like protein [Gemmatimonadetes bacterium]|nr:collagen-like protein [Gemmatimonadota bacterium]